MHKAKANTKHSDVTSSDPKNTTPPPERERPALDQIYAPFYDGTIEVADQSKLGAAPLMREMNRMHQIVTGLGVVLRIVASNSSLAADPDLGGLPPLSPSSEYSLTAMAAAICEEMSSSIANRADFYNDEAEA